MCKDARANPLEPSPQQAQGETTGMPFITLILYQHQGGNIISEKYNLLPFLREKNPVCVFACVDFLTANELFSLPPHMQMVTKACCTYLQSFSSPNEPMNHLGILLLHRTWNPRVEPGSQNF